MPGKRLGLNGSSVKQPTAFIKVTKVATQSPMMTFKKSAIGQPCLLPAHYRGQCVLAQLLKAVSI